MMLAKLGKSIRIILWCGNFSLVKLGTPAGDGRFRRDGTTYDFAILDHNRLRWLEVCVWADNSLRLHLTSRTLTRLLLGCRNFIERTRLFGCHVSFSHLDHLSIIPWTTEDTPAPFSAHTHIYHHAAKFVLHLLLFLIFRPICWVAIFKFQGQFWGRFSYQKLLLWLVFLLV